jgi:hypothetical protein
MTNASAPHLKEVGARSVARSLGVAANLSAMNEIHKVVAAVIAVNIKSTKEIGSL